MLPRPIGFEAGFCWFGWYLCYDAAPIFDDSCELRTDAGLPSTILLSLTDVKPRSDPVLMSLLATGPIIGVA